MENAKAVAENAPLSIHERHFEIERKKVSVAWSMQKYHYHGFVEIYYLLGGARYYFIEDKTYYIKEGDLVTVCPYDMHATGVADKAPYERVLISFSREYLDFLPKELFGGDIFAFLEGGSRVVEFTPKEKREVEFLLEEMLDEYLQKREDSEAFLKNSLVRLLLILNRKSEKNEREIKGKMSESARLVANVCGAVNQRFAENISLSALAAEFFVSTSYLSRSFSRVTGTPFTEYLNAVRVKEAQKLLLSTDMSVAEIAEAVGYSGTTHFDRMFKRVAKMKPLDFRKSGTL